MIYVIGGANIDIFAKNSHDLILRDSNPTKLSFSFGGVGHNIALNLAKLKEKVQFVSVFSHDHFSKGLIEDCVSIGLSLDHAIYREDYPSSMYIAIMDKDNDMYLGLSDMSILESLKWEEIVSLKEIIKDDDYLIADTNLSETILAKILMEFKGVKVSDAISVNKVHKLSKVLDKLDIIKLNRLEAEALCAMKLTSDEDVKKALLDLKDKGAKEVVITDKDGLYLLRDEKCYRFCHGHTRNDLKNATGAGDSLLAAYVYMHQRSDDLKKVVTYALANALLTIDDENTVSNVNIERLEKKAQELKIEGGEI